MSKKSTDNRDIRKRNRISRELPSVGIKLVGRSKGQVYEAVIVKSSADPKRRAVSLQGREFYTLSGAAMAVTGHAVNGWLFWKIKSKSQ
ncbi:MAG: hypothetical protein PHI12_10350 [Dehalococcoidales bacterium]|nr:hypothetical protein [Dehalococcoidales bacterium]